MTTRPTSADQALKVLVVDDCADTTALMLTLLKRRGHSARCAGTAAAALSLFGELGDWHLLLVDCGLPDLDGLELARRLRSNGCQGMIVAVTGNSREQDRAAALAAGCDDFVSKPLGRQRLEALLAAAAARVQ